MLNRLQLPAGMLQTLTGMDSDDADSLSQAYAVLRTGQLSRRLLVLRSVIDETRQRAAADARKARFEAAFSLLRWAQRQSADRTSEVLTYPYVGVRLASWLRRLCGAEQGPGPLWRDLAGLAEVAAAAAVRTGEEFTTTVPLRDGVAVLPGLGCAVVGSDEDWATVVRDCDGVRITAGARSVHLPEPLDRPAPGWRSVRTLHTRAGPHALTTVMDDVDPVRDCYGIAPVGWLSPADLARWHRLVGAAWAELVECHPHHAAVLGQGLRALTPLVQSGRHEGVSASARAAFGAIGLTEPASSGSLAVSLIHEFRHSVLNGILDLTPLCEDPGVDRFYSPWRSDPRPVDGLLHGAFAFLGVADFWRVRRTVTAGESRDQANFEFVRCREQVLQAARTLAVSGRLTGPGERVVHRIVTIAESWQTEPEAAKVGLAAQRSMQLHHLAWRVRNVQVERADVEALALAWLRGQRAPALVARSILVDAGEVTFADHTGWRPARGSDRLTADANAALAAGDHRSALRYLRRCLLAGAASDLVWAGLAQCIAAVCGEPAARLVTGEPELVAALYGRIARQQRHAPDPVALALWLARPTAD